MKENNLIQTNKISFLHDDEQIIFCKRDVILEEYKRISQLDRDVILIVGNSDYTFDSQIFELRPKNVKHFFAQNSTVINDICTPLPIGVENEILPKRHGHGAINNEIFQKKDLLVNPPETEIENKIDLLYSNFSVNTQRSVREPIKNLSINSPHITWEHGVSYQHFVNQIKNHKATLSPRGNGIECIRTYEVLYLNEIPICIGDRAEYSATIEGIYKFLPIVFIDNLDYLMDIKYIDSEIKKVKNNSRELLDFEYWESKIIETVKKVL